MAIRKSLQRTAKVHFNRMRGYAVQSKVKLPIVSDVLSKNVESALANEVYEGQEMAAVLGLFRPGDTVLELGGGLGYLSTCLRLHSEVGKIIVYEGNPRLIEYIKETHRANDSTDIDVRHGVVMLNPPEKIIPFYIREHMWASSLSAQALARDRTIAVADVPAVSWMTVLNEVQPTAVAVDIEGGEYELIGKTSHFGSIERMVIELHPAQYGVAGMASIFSSLDRQGFSRADRLCKGNVWAVERVASPKATDRRRQTTLAT